MENSLTITLKYKPTAFTTPDTRKVKFTGMSDSGAVWRDIERKMAAFNDSLSAGDSVATSLSTFYIGDNSGGLASIEGGVLERVEETPITIVRGS